MKNFILLFLTMLAGIVTGWLAHYELDVGDESARRDTVFTTDTFCYIMPCATRDTVVSYVTRWLPVANANPSGMRNEEPHPPCVADGTSIHNAQTDTFLICSTSAGGLPDSCNVVIPITQKTYHSDDYTAWISGYEPSLDSIKVYRHTEIITMDKKRRRWGCVAGIGAGITTHGDLLPMIGVTFGYRLY